MMASCGGRGGGLSEETLPACRAELEQEGTTPVALGASEPSCLAPLS